MKSPGSCCAVPNCGNHVYNPNSNNPVERGNHSLLKLDGIKLLFIKLVILNLNSEFFFFWEREKGISLNVLTSGSQWNRFNQILFGNKFNNILKSLILRIWIKNSLFYLPQVCVTTKEMCTPRERNGMMAVSTSVPVWMPLWADISVIQSKSTLNCKLYNVFRIEQFYES